MPTIFLRTFQLILFMALIMTGVSQPFQVILDDQWDPINSPSHRFNNVLQMPDGGLLLSYRTGSEWSILRLDQSANVSWSRAYRPDSVLANTFPWSMTHDPSGNVLLVTDVWRELDTDQLYAIAIGATMVMVAPDGSLLWSKAITFDVSASNMTDVFPKAAVSWMGGNYHLVVYSNNNVGGDGNVLSITQLDVSGNVSWSKYWADRGAQDHGIQARHNSPDLDASILNTSSGTILFVHASPNDQNEGALFIEHLAMDGTLLWSKRMDLLNDAVEQEGIPHVMEKQNGGYLVFCRVFSTGLGSRNLIVELDGAGNVDACHMYDDTFGDRAFEPPAVELPDGSIRTGGPYQSFFDTTLANTTSVKWEYPDPNDGFSYWTFPQGCDLDDDTLAFCTRVRRIDANAGIEWNTFGIRKLPVDMSGGCGLIASDWFIMDRTALPQSAYQVLTLTPPVDAFYTIGPIPYVTDTVLEPNTTELCLVLDVATEDSNDHSAVDLHPNPVSMNGLLNVLNAPEGTLRLFDGIGRVVLESRLTGAAREFVGLAGVLPGIYLAQMIGNDGSVRGAGRVIIQ